MIALLKRKYTNLVHDERFSEILSGSAWALSARVAATGLGLVTSIIVARFYGAEMLGIVAVLNSFLMLVTIFTLLGTNTAILRLIPEHLSKYSATSAYNLYRKIRFSVTALSLITGVVFLLGSEFVADTIFSKPHLRFYFALAAVFIVFKTLMDLNTQAVRGVRLIRTFAVMQLLPSLSKLVILIVITFFFFNPDNPVYATFISIALTALAGTAIMNRAFRQKVSSQDTVHPMATKEILDISLPMLMVVGMFFLINQIGVIVLGMYRPEAEVGYYSIAVKLATLTVFALQAVNSMAAPTFSALFHTGQREELFYVAKKATRLIFWSTSPVLVVLIVSGKPALAMIYGHDYVAAYGAMVILVIGQFINGICGSTGVFMNMTGNQNILRNIIAIAAVICVAMNLLLVPEFGLTGAAVSSVIGILSWNAAVLVFMKIRFGRTTAYIPFYGRKAE